MKTKELFATLESLMPLFMEQFEQGKSVIFSPKGVSMRPLLRQGFDSVVLSPISGELRKYDIPLYQYHDGRYVLHRIVDVKQNEYVCLGDNTYCYESVKPEYLIAVVTAVKRGNRVIPVEAFGYRMYCRIWVGIYPLRKFCLRVIRWLRRHLK